MTAAPQYPPGYLGPTGPHGVLPSPRKRRARWKLVLPWVGAIGGLLILIVLAGLVALNSKTMHRYVLRVVEQKATAALGTDVRLGDFKLHFSGISPTLDIYDLVIQGRESPPHPPLAQVSSLHLGLTVASLLRRKWYVNEVILTRPIVHLSIDVHGDSNLPRATNKQTKEPTAIFDLGVRHFQVLGGAVDYNDRKSSINADLHELGLETRYEPLAASYRGSLVYRDGHLAIENFTPLPHELAAEFVAARDQFTLTRAVLRSGASNLELTATLNDYAQPKLKAEYHASLDCGEFREILHNPSLPIGIVRAGGTLDYSSRLKGPMLEAASVEGDLTSSQLLIKSAGWRTVITDIASHYRLAHGNLDVPDLRAGLLGGRLRAVFRVQDLAGRSRSRLTAALSSASLRSAQSLENSSTVRGLGISGLLNAHLDAAWGKNLDDLVARADGAINAGIAGASESDRVPLDGSLNARYDRRRKEIELASSFLRTPHTSLTMDGIVSERSALKVFLRSSDLHELETIAQLIRPGGPALGLYGLATVDAAVTGSTEAPRVAGQLNAANLRVKGVPWRLLRSSLSLNPSEIRLANGQLESAQGGRITFSMSAGLRHWSFDETSPVELALDASEIDLREISRAAGIASPITGMLAAHIYLHGSELYPLGQGKISLTRAAIKDEPLDSLTLQFQGLGESLEASLSARMPAGATNASFMLAPKQRSYRARLQSDGIRLERLETLKRRNLPVAGVLSLSAAGAGSLDNPEFSATLGVPELSLRDQKISGLKLHTSLANHVASCDLSSEIFNTPVSGHAKVNLTGDYPIDGVLDTKAIPLGPLVAAYAPAQSGAVSGETELHAQVHGPWKQKARLEAQLTIPTLTASYKNDVTIAAAGPIRAHYASGVLELERSALRGTGTDLEFQGSVPLTSQAPGSMLLQGSVDLGIARMLDPDIASSGQLRFDVNTYGRRENPNVHGQIRIVNAGISTEAVPLGLQNGNGVLTLLEDRLQITQFHGLLGGGDFTASGAVVYRPSVHFDLALVGHDSRVLYNNVRGTFDSKLALVGGMESAELQGQIRVAQLQFTPAFDLVDFMGSLGGAASTPAAVGGFDQALKLNVGVDSTAGVNPVSRTMSLQATANLRVRGTAAQPVILGRINLNGGDLIYRGNRYVLQQGTVDFVNPSETQAVVNVSANTQVQQFNVQMHFWGPADHLHTNYSSDPALPPSDIINLIAFGKTQEANPNAPGNLSAEQTVASQVSNLVTNRVEKVAGLSQLSVDPLLGSNQGENPGARITVQQRMTGKIFVTFSSDVTSTQSSTIKLEYHQSPRISYSGTRDQNGGFGFDRRIHIEW